MPENTPARRPLRRRSRAVAALAAATAILGGSLALAPAAVAAEAPPTIGAVTLTAPAAADEGDTVEVVIAVDASADVFAYELAVTYDPALLALVDGESTFPTGGFDAVADDAGTATFTHTRLGTSPGLSGAQELVTFSFTALGGATAEIAVSDATFLSASGTAIGLPEGAVVSATTALTAAPEPPSPSPCVTSISGTPAASSPHAMARICSSVIWWRFGCMPSRNVMSWTVIFLPCRLVIVGSFMRPRVRA